MAGDDNRTTVGDYVTLVRGTTYKGQLVGKPGPALLGLGSIEPGGGFRIGNYKTYGGDCPDELMLFPGEIYASLKGATKDGKMIGSVARVPLSVPSGRITQDTVKLVFRNPNPKDETYLYWVLRTPQYRDYCSGHAMGSAVVALSRRDFLSYPVPLPTAQRRMVVDLLDAIEEKIELNRRMSETLEAMARALFKSWFVDFDPVRAKMDLPSPSGRGVGGEGTTSPIRANAPIPTKFLDFARQLRSQATDAESLLWRLLRGRQIAAAKFRRQHPFPPYILDFYCYELKLAVELDGGQHNEEAGRRKDARRDEYLTEHGIRVLRFWNSDVLRETEAVLEAIYAAVVERLKGVPSPPPPLPVGEGCLSLPKHIADLFPDRLVDSELGEIPEGWEVGTLGDVADHPRRAVRPEQIELGTPYIALEHMPKQCIALSEWGAGDGLESNKFRFKRGEILFGKLRPYFHKVGVAPVDGVCSTDIVVVAPRAPEWFGFVLGHTSSAEFVDFTDAGSTGTKMPRTNWKDMSRYDVVLPPQSLAMTFTNMIQPAFDRMIAGIHESHTLASMRDTLLPKLISGEVRVRTAERLIEEIL